MVNGRPECAPNVCVPAPGVTENFMGVAVLGACLRGACVAMELARSGIAVDLFDKNERCVSQASAQNEGKIPSRLYLCQRSHPAHGVGNDRRCAQLRITTAPLVGLGLYVRAHGQAEIPQLLATDWPALERWTGQLFVTPAHSSASSANPPATWFKRKVALLLRRG